jgi:lysozyme family protein
VSDDPNFTKALTFLLKHEGGFVDDAADPGGATKFGITLHELQGLGHLDGLNLDIGHSGSVTIQDIRNLTPDEAAAIYRIDWWDRYGFARIHDAAVAAKLFDLFVNIGPGEAVRILQRAISAAWFPTVVTGKWEEQVVTKGRPGWLLLPTHRPQARPREVPQRLAHPRLFGACLRSNP